jgi:hypothetical protein
MRSAKRVVRASVLILGSWLGAFGSDLDRSIDGLMRREMRLWRYGIYTYYLYDGDRSTVNGDFTHDVAQSVEK